MARETWPPLAEVAQALAQRAEALVPELLPAGRRHGREWLIGSVDGEPGRSLHVSLFGARAGRWRDFSSERQGGDLIDLICAVRGMTLVEAWEWAIDWLGWRGRGQPVARPASRPSVRPAAARDDRADRDRRAAAALGLFLAGRRLVRGDPVDGYLRGRGIDLALLGRQPGALRYHPELMTDDRYFPAMVALIQDPLNGKPIGVHRTFLARQPSGGWGKAAIEAPKKVLGGMRGGWIPLSRGASGRPLPEAPGDDILALAEGIEDALTVALAEPAWRVGAVVCAGNFVWTRWPTNVRRVRICADNDPPGSPAAEAVMAAAAALAGSGREVAIIRPPEGYKDLNALLRHDRGAASSGCIGAAA